MRILVLEDVPAMRRLLVHVLQADGHVVAQGEDGTTAYDEGTISRLDVMVVDIDLPRVNGIEAILTARRFNPNLQIIAISGGGTSHRDDYLNVCRELGAAAILKKPFEPDVLVNLVRDLGSDAQVA